MVNCQDGWKYWQKNLAMFGNRQVILALTDRYGREIATVLAQIGSSGAISRSHREIGKAVRSECEEEQSDPD